MSARIDIRAGATSLSDAEREAVRLYYEEVADLPTISAMTGLSYQAVRAATDRVAAMTIDRIRTTAERHEVPSLPSLADPAPPRRRVVRPAQLPGAHTPPSTVELPVHELVAPADARPAATAATPPTEPASRPHPTAAEFAPGTPAWTALATSPAVRRWAIADGWTVPPAGQSLPGAIVLAYHAAHPTGGAP